MDYINNYSGGATKKEKEIVKKLIEKYPELKEKEYITASNRFKKQKGKTIFEEKAREIITNKEDEKLLDEYIKIFYTR